MGFMTRVAKFKDSSIHFPADGPQSRYRDGPPPVALADVVDGGAVAAVVDEHRRRIAGHVLQGGPGRVGQLLDKVQVEGYVHIGGKSKHSF